MDLYTERDWYLHTLVFIFNFYTPGLIDSRNKATNTQISTHTALYNLPFTSERAATLYRELNPSSVLGHVFYLVFKCDETILWTLVRASVSTILIPTWFIRLYKKWQIIRKRNMKTCPSTEGGLNLLSEPLYSLSLSLSSWLFTITTAINSIVFKSII